MSVRKVFYLTIYSLFLIFASGIAVFYFIAQPYIESDIGYMYYKSGIDNIQGGNASDKEYGYKELYHAAHYHEIPEAQAAYMISSVHGKLVNNDLTDEEKKQSGKNHIITDIDFALNCNRLKKVFKIQNFIAQKHIAVFKCLIKERCDSNNTLDIYNLTHKCTTENASK